MYVCVRLNGIVIKTYVDPASLDYLLSPFNEDAAHTNMMEPADESCHQKIKDKKSCVAKTQDFLAELNANSTRVFVI